MSRETKIFNLKKNIEMLDKKMEKLEFQKQVYLRHLEELETRLEEAKIPETETSATTES